VDIRDYGVWRQHFGAMNAGNPADGDQNNIVDIRDYGIWRQHFGEGMPAGTDRGTRAQAGVRPLLGAPPVPGVRLLSLARQPVPAAAPGVSSAAADPWPRRLLAHLGPVRPPASVAAWRRAMPHRSMLLRTE
jgi:hypothetical protein